MEYFISALIGYLSGSVPFAYILVKNAQGIDITKTGSGNAGAMNSFEVSKSKLIGIQVLMLDAVKGLLSVYLPLFIFPVSFIFPALGLLFAVFGHCYSPWINFKGGRGLATCAGGAILVFPFLLIVWIVYWMFFYLFKRDILFANIFAIVLSLLSVLILANVSVKYTNPHADSAASVLLFSCSVLLVIFSKHIEPLKELLNVRQKSSEGNDGE